MAFTELSNDGTTNGVTPVTIVTAPGAATKRLVRFVSFQNPMASEAVTLTFYFDNGGVVRNIWKGTLVGGETFVCDDDLFILNATDKSLKAVLEGAPSDELDFTAAYGDST